MGWKELNTKKESVISIRLNPLILYFILSISLFPEFQQWSFVEEEITLE